jgi:hypothetical protein
MGAAGCVGPQGTVPPPEGWANAAPTVVVAVVDRDDEQLLSVRQEHLQTWVRVPDVDAEVGDYVLLGQGTAEHNVIIPEVEQTAPEVVTIAHVQVVDLAVARRELKPPPADTVAIATVYAELAARADKEIVVHGTVVKSTHAVGWYWVHLQDGTGNIDDGTHDLTIRSASPVTRGQRVAFRGVLRQDVNLGFGYHYDALVEATGTLP